VESLDQSEWLSTSTTGDFNHRFPFGRMVIASVFSMRLVLQILFRVIRLVPIDVMDIFVVIEQPTDLVLDNHSMQRIESLRICEWVFRVCPTVHVPTAAACR
jgi:hypothetical protein